MQLAIDDAKTQGKEGLVTIVGTNKFHFMSDTKWLIRQGFETCEKTNSGFSLLLMKINQKAENPKFKASALVGESPDKSGLVVYYSNRCPFTEFYVQTSLTITENKRKLPLKIIKLETMEQAQSAPSPATIFSLFYNGKFITTDLSVCIDTRFDKIISI